MPDSLVDLRDRLRKFSSDREWDKYHTPKNLTCALSVEVAELLEHFQWTGDSDAASEARARRDEVAEELADILIYTVRLADVVDVDLLEAADRKLLKNASKYPVELARGRSTKYTEL